MNPTLVAPHHLIPTVARARQYCRGSALAPVRSVSARFRYSRRDYNLGLHIRMQTAEIFKRSCFIEGEAELVLGVERRRTKRAISRYDRMHDVIVVLPHHRRPDRDRDDVGLEGEIINYRWRLGFRPVRPSPRRRSNKPPRLLRTRERCHGTGTCKGSVFCKAPAPAPA